MMVRAEKKRKERSGIGRFLTFLFSIMGIFIGTEVHVPFTVITVAVALGMGFDAVTGAAMVLGGAIGFATAPINASTIGTCDAISGLPLFSEMGLRTVFWLCSTAAVCMVTSAYAKKSRSSRKRAWFTEWMLENWSLQKTLANAK